MDYQHRPSSFSRTHYLIWSQHLATEKENLRGKYQQLHLTKTFWKHTQTVRPTVTSCISSWKHHPDYLPQDKMHNYNYGISMPKYLKAEKSFSFDPHLRLHLRKSYEPCEYKVTDTYLRDYNKWNSFEWLAFGITEKITLINKGVNSQMPCLCI